MEFKVKTDAERHLIAHGEHNSVVRETFPEHLQKSL